MKHFWQLISLIKHLSTTQARLKDLLNYNSETQNALDVLERTGLNFSLKEEFDILGSTPICLISESWTRLIPIMSVC